VLIDDLLDGVGGGGWGGVDQTGLVGLDLGSETIIVSLVDDSSGSAVLVDQGVLASDGALSITGFLSAEGMVGVLLLEGELVWGWGLILSWSGEHNSEDGDEDSEFLLVRKQRRGVWLV